jgi:hypothetical protein
MPLQGFCLAWIPWDCDWLVTLYGFSAAKEDKKGWPGTNVFIPQDIASATETGRAGSNNCREEVG